MTSTRGVDAELISVMEDSIMLQRPACSNCVFFALRSSIKVCPVVTSDDMAVWSPLMSVRVRFVESPIDWSPELRALMRLVASDWICVASPLKALTEVSSWLMADDTCATTELIVAASRTTLDGTLG
jgi:hypothetical protein